jgi:hypothetical protein
MGAGGRQIDGATILGAASLGVSRVRVLTFLLLRPACFPLADRRLSRIPAFGTRVSGSHQLLIFSRD